MAKQFVPLFTSEEIADVAELYATATDDYAEVRLGETVFFWKGLAKVRYAPFSSIAWAYMRQEDSRMTICCGKGLYNSFFLMLADANGAQVKIPIERESNVRGVLLALQERCPSITIGYTEQNAARFMVPVRVREIAPDDYPLLEDFLYHAIFVPHGMEAPPRSIIRHPGVSIYIDGFGDKRGDMGVVAEANGRVVGAAWERIIPAFGHIDDNTPELAISVLPGYRGRAIGTLMMTRLFELLRERGYEQTSLAVQKMNAAVRFYQRLGYETIRESEEEFIMVKDLRDA